MRTRALLRQAWSHSPLPTHHSVIFCEAVAIYGVIVSIILQTKMEKPDMSKAEAAFVANRNFYMASGYALFWAGICCGVGNLACGSISPPRLRP